MALSATLLFYCQLTKSGAGVTGKAGSITATIKKVTRGSTPTITTVSTGGGITVGSVTEVDATNAKGLYVVGVSGLDPAADYLCGAHYTGTASDVDLVDVPALWSEFSPSINAGALPQVAAASAGGVPTVGTGTGQINVTGGRADADVLRWLGTAVTAGTTAGKPDVVTVTNNDKTGYGLSAAAVQAIWDAATSVLTTAGSIGKWIVDKLDAAVSSRYSGTQASTDVTALTTAINNLNNLSALANLFGPSVLEIPDSSTTQYPLTLTVKDEEGHLVDLDASPTVTATNAAGTDRSANLSAVTHPSTGVYTFTYGVASTAAEEGLRIVATGAVASSARRADLNVAVANYDSVTTLNSIKTQTDKIGSTSADSSNITAIKAKTDNLPASPAAVGDIPTASTIAAAVWAVATSTLTTAGTIGKWAMDLITGMAAQLTTDHGAGSYARNTEPDNTSIAAVKVVTDKVATMLATSASNYTFTVDALKNAPAGGGGGGTTLTLNVESTELRA